MENNKGTPPIQKNLDDKNNGHEIERSTARLFDSKRVDITGFKLNEIMGLTDELRRSGKPTTLMLGIRGQGKALLPNA